MKNVSCICCCYRSCIIRILWQQISRNTEVAETETEATVEEVVAPAEQATTEETAVAEGDSTAVEAPAAETEAAPAE